MSESDQKRELCVPSAMSHDCETVSSVFANTEAQKFVDQHWGNSIRSVGELWPKCTIEVNLANHRAESFTNSTTGCCQLWKCLKLSGISIWKFPVFRCMWKSIDLVIKTPDNDQGVFAFLELSDTDPRVEQPNPGDRIGQLFVMSIHGSSIKSFFDKLVWFIPCESPVWEHIKTKQSYHTITKFKPEHLGYNGFIYVNDGAAFEEWATVNTIISIVNAVSEWDYFNFEVPEEYLDVFWDLVLVRAVNDTTTILPSDKSEYKRTNGLIRVVTLVAKIEELRQRFASKRPLSSKITLTMQQMNWISSHLGSAKFAKEFSEIPAVIFLPSGSKNLDVKILCFSESDVADSCRMLNDILSCNADRTDVLYLYDLPIAKPVLDKMLFEISLREHVRISLISRSDSCCYVLITGSFEYLEKAKLAVKEMWSYFRKRENTKCKFSQDPGDYRKTIDLDYAQYVSLLFDNWKLPNNVQLNVHRGTLQFLTKRVIINQSGVLDVYLVDKNVIKGFVVDDFFDNVFCKFGYNDTLDKRVPLDKFSKYFGLAEDDGSLCDHNSGKDIDKFSTRGYLLRAKDKYVIRSSDHIGSDEASLEFFKSMIEHTKMISGTILFHVSPLEWFTLKAAMQSLNLDGNKCKVLIVADKILRDHIEADHVDITLENIPETRFKASLEIIGDTTSAGTTYLDIQSMSYGYETVVVPEIGCVLEYVNLIKHDIQSRYPVNVLVNSDGKLCLSGSPFVVRSTLRDLEIKAISSHLDRIGKDKLSKAVVIKEISYESQEFNNVVSEIRKSVSGATNFKIRSVRNDWVDGVINVLADELGGSKIEKRWWRSTCIDPSELVKFGLNFDFSTAEELRTISADFKLYSKISDAHAKFGKQKHLFLVDELSFGSGNIKFKTSSVARIRTNYLIEYTISISKS